MSTRREVGVRGDSSNFWIFFGQFWQFSKSCNAWSHGRVLPVQCCGKSSMFAVAMMARAPRCLTSPMSQWSCLLAFGGPCFRCQHPDGGWKIRPRGMQRYTRVSTILEDVCYFLNRIFTFHISIIEQVQITLHPRSKLSHRSFIHYSSFCDLLHQASTASKRYIHVLYGIVRYNYMVPNSRGCGCWVSISGSGTGASCFVGSKNQNGAGTL